jgi:hypothetical protein
MLLERQPQTLGLQSIPSSGASNFPSVAPRQTEPITLLVIEPRERVRTE